MARTIALVDEIDLTIATLSAADIAAFGLASNEALALQFIARAPQEPGASGSRSRTRSRSWC